jgi:hypothetical protein
VLTLVWLTPYFAYVQYQLGIVNYFRTGLAISGSEATRTRLGRLTFDDVPEGPWIISQPEDLSRLPSFRIRWKPDVEDGRRRAIETELGLLAPEHAEGRTWRYRLEPPGHETLSRLVARSEVEDTSGFDRTALTIADERGLVSRTLSIFGLDRLARLGAGPRLIGLLGPHNVSVTLFFVLWSLPPIAIALIAMQPQRATDPGRSLTLVAAAVMVVCAAGLLRDSLAERIPDIYGSAPFLLACVIGAGWQTRPRQRVARLALRAALVVVALGFITGTFLLGRVPSQLNRARVADGPGAVWQRIEDVFHHTREWPWASEWPAGNGWKVARYVHDCTRPGDRLLLTWSAPEMNVFSRRVFAGGETALMPVFRDPSGYEGAVLARLSRQSVPIVLVDPEVRADFYRAYPAIGKYLDERFRKVGEFTTDARQIHIYAERERRATGTDAEFGWPCFAAPPAPATAGRL